MEETEALYNKNADTIFDIKYYNRRDIGINLGARLI